MTQTVPLPIADGDRFLTISQPSDGEPVALTRSYDVFRDAAGSGFSVHLYESLRWSLDAPELDTFRTAKVLEGVPSKTDAVYLGERWLRLGD